MSEWLHEIGFRANPDLHLAVMAASQPNCLSVATSPNSHVKRKKSKISDWWRRSMPPSLPPPLKITKWIQRLNAHQHQHCKLPFVINRRRVGSDDLQALMQSEEKRETLKFTRSTSKGGNE